MGSDGLVTDLFASVELRLQCNVSFGPTEKNAMLFPGQGTNVAASVRKLVNSDGADGVRDYFRRASDVLGYDLLNLCLNEPEKLERTMFSQPAIMVTSLAAVHKLTAANPDAANKFTHAAGFSLGEYSALVFAGAMTLEDALRLVKRRAEVTCGLSCVSPSGGLMPVSSPMQLMNEAAEASPQSMATIIGLSDEQLKQLCRDAETE